MREGSPTPNKVSFGLMRSEEPAVLGFKVVGVGRRTGCILQSRFGWPVGRLRAHVHPVTSRVLVSDTNALVKSYTAPGTLLVLISLHARFPSPEFVTPPKTQTRIHHANELHEAAKRYLRSVLRPTIDLGRNGWAGSSP